MNISEWKVFFFVKRYSRVLDPHSLDSFFYEWQISEESFYARQQEFLAVSAENGFVCELNECIRVLHVFLPWRGWHGMWESFCLRLLSYGVLWSYIVVQCCRSFSSTCGRAASGNLGKWFIAWELSGLLLIFIWELCKDLRLIESFYKLFFIC
jgi:hypothetical protein